VSFFVELNRRNVFRVALAYAVVAWLVMQVADTLAPALLLPDWATRFVAFMLILGFPLAIFFAWAFELTPEGIKREKSVRRENSIARHTGRKLDFLIIGLLAVAVAYFAWDGFSGEQALSESAPESASPVASTRHSIAVLPFVNMSDDPQQEYFSDGLSEELLNLLARIPQLRVTSRSSAFSFKGKEFTIVEVGRTLNVNHVLEGSVRRSGDEIRITAQLINAGDDAHVWSATWDRKFDNVFAIQDEIAGEVVNALKIQLVDELPHAYITKPGAYELYLKALPLAGEGTEAGMSEAKSLLEQVLTIDPDYAPALVLLGDAWQFFGSWGYRPMEQSFERARSYGQRAIEAAPGYSGGYMLLSDVALSFDLDRARAARLAGKALEIDPQDIEARRRLAYLQSLQGDHGANISVAEEAARLDPLSGEPYWRLGHALLRARQYDASVAAFRKLEELQPDRVAVHAALAEALVLGGQHEAALAEFEADPLEGFTLYGQAITYHLMGDRERSDAAMEQLKNLDDADWWAAQIAMAHAMRGDSDEAFKWLEIGLELNDQGLPSAESNPFFDSLRDDPRFDEFIRRLYSGSGSSAD
jgi:TolB-like protein/Flp pilus assembly protein TadD